MFTLSWSLLIKISRGTGVGIPLYKPYRYVPHQRQGFCAVLVFVQFGLDLGMVFEETSGL